MRRCFEMFSKKGDKGRQVYFFPFLLAHGIVAGEQVPGVTLVHQKSDGDKEQAHANNEVGHWFSRLFKNLGNCLE